MFIVHIYTIYILYISPFEFKLQDGRPCASYKALRFSQANSDIESMFNNVQDFGRLNLWISFWKEHMSIMLGHHKNTVAFCSTTWMQVLLKPTWHFVASCKVFLGMQLLKTTWAFCSKWYVLVCAIIENEGVFCSKGKINILLCQGCWNEWAFCR